MLSQQQVAFLVEKVWVKCHTVLGLLRAQHTYQVPILGDRFLKIDLGALVSKNIFSKVFGLFPAFFLGKSLES